MTTEVCRRFEWFLETSSQDSEDRAKVRIMYGFPFVRLYSGSRTQDGYNRGSSLRLLVEFSLG